ncbi:MAG: cupin domain-containing protein [Spirosomataceae bacterium]
MNETKKIIESGIVDEFCMGLLSAEDNLKVRDWAAQYPAVAQHIETTLAALQTYSSITPTPTLKAKTLSFIGELNKESNLRLEDKPQISKYSDIVAWNKLLDAEKPAEDFESMKVKFLIDDPTHQLCLAWLETELTEEAHHDEEFTESFLILEGSCECNIGGKIIRLAAGDFLEIPENTPHTIRNTSTHLPFVKALIQRIAA